MTTEAENFEKSVGISLSDDSDIEILADEKGREIRKSAEHPDKTREIICLENGEEDEEDEETTNLNNNSVVLDRVTKNTEVHETISVSPTINSGTIKEYLTELGLGILKCRENGIVLFHCDNLWLNGKNASEADASPSDIRR